MRGCNEMLRGRRKRKREERERNTVIECDIGGVVGESWQYICDHKFTNYDRKFDD